MPACVWAGAGEARRGASLVPCLAAGAGAGLAGVVLMVAAGAGLSLADAVLGVTLFLWGLQGVHLLSGPSHAQVFAIFDVRFLYSNARLAVEACFAGFPWAAWAGCSSGWSAGGDGHGP